MPHPPFRADHVGSLLRPPELREARARFKSGAIDAAALRRVEDAAIRDAVARQEAIGLEAITDGEFRRDFWHLDFIAGLQGIRLKASTAMKFHGVEEIPPTPQVVGRVGCAQPIMVDHFSFLRSVTRRTPKFTIPGPAMVHLRGGTANIPHEIYPDVEQFWADLGAAYRQAIAHLARAGCTYLQIDDVTFAYLADEKVRAMAEKNGDDPERLAWRYADAVNQALAARPPGMTVTMHTCRGNFQSTWVAEKPYAARATEAMFATNVDAFFMEFDSERSGGFEILKLLPADKSVVLGLVTTKLGALEEKAALARRINEATRYVPLERLALSPQCGFSSTHHGNKLAYDEQWRKLERVVEVAREVWRA